MSLKIVITSNNEVIWIGVSTRMSRTSAKVYVRLPLCQCRAILYLSTFRRIYQSYMPECETTIHIMTACRSIKPLSMRVHLTNNDGNCEAKSVFLINVHTRMHQLLYQTFHYIMWIRSSWFSVSTWSCNVAFVHVYGTTDNALCAAYPNCSCHSCTCACACGFSLVLWTCAL